MLRAVGDVLAASPVPVLVRLASGTPRHYAAIAEVLRASGVRGVVVRHDFVDFEKFLLDAGRDFEVVVTGGIASGFDVQRSLAKGARALQVDVALQQEGPGIFARLARELRYARGERG